MVRQEIATLQSLGPPPDEEGIIKNNSVELLKRYEVLLESVHPPITDEEACVLTELLPHDDSSIFGFAWTLLHLIETAPGWPIASCLRGTENWWINFLRDRAERGGKRLP